MDTSNSKAALKDLIIRLQDAEKGFLEISRAVSNSTLKKWLKNYADERHQMHKVLEGMVEARGGEAEVKTSFLGDLHRMFIDIKINSTNADDEYDAVVTEIERGAKVLIDDYEKVLDEVEMLPSMESILKTQKAIVENELTNLVSLKEEFNSIPA